jgi:hypothetical protein
LLNPEVLFRLGVLLLAKRFKERSLHDREATSQNEKQK